MNDLKKKMKQCRQISVLCYIIIFYFRLLYPLTSPSFTDCIVNTWRVQISPGVVANVTATGIYSCSIVPNQMDHNKLDMKFNMRPNVSVDISFWATTKAKMSQVSFYCHSAQHQKCKAERNVKHGPIKNTDQINWKRYITE